MIQFQRSLPLNTRIRKTIAGVIGKVSNQSLVAKPQPTLRNKFMDDKFVGSLLGILWLGWLIYWGVAAFKTKPAARSESRAERWSYIAPMVMGGVLLTIHNAGNPLAQTYLPLALHPLAAGTGLLCVAIGLGFSIWARSHLAENWSANVTLKEGHELIRIGPYAWVRHPIYTGLLLALIGTAVSGEQIGGLIAIGLFAAGLVRKLRLEEKWLAEIFPDYAAYQTAVRALIPLIY